VNLKSLKTHKIRFNVSFIHTEISCFFLHYW